MCDLMKKVECKKKKGFNLILWILNVLKKIKLSFENI
jgi:hypothetical protein